MSNIGSEDLNNKLNAWAEHIRAGVLPGESLALVGLIRHGDVLARRLAEKLQQAGISVHCGALDISLYRDDWDLQANKMPLHSSYLPFSTDGLKVILIDDVIHTGRTVRAALNALFEYGRPASVELHCLVDRCGRQLPIQPDYTAYPTPMEREVTVHLQEIDGYDDIEY